MNSQSPKFSKLRHGAGPTGDRRVAASRPLLVLMYAVRYISQVAPPMHFSKIWQLCEQPSRSQRRTFALTPRNRERGALHLLRILESRVKEGVKAALAGVPPPTST